MAINKSEMLSDVSVLLVVHVAAVPDQGQAVKNSLIVTKSHE